MIEAKVVADSINQCSMRITTLELVYPRWILAEFNTHRMFSRNSASSRAIPTIKIMKEVANNPAMPVSWKRNQKGMQGGEELDANTAKRLRDHWLRARDYALQQAWHMHESGLAKETVNRVLEPFMHARTLVTATDWDNFFELRMHKDAQPEFRVLAEAMYQAMATSQPTYLEDGWHKPYAKKDEPLYRSIARAARVSYKTHDNKETTPEADVKLVERLLAGGHMSPFEHQAYPKFIASSFKSNNFSGWVQLRHEIQQPEIKHDRSFIFDRLSQLT